MDLKQLTDKEIASLNVLFLAPFAPLEHDKEPPPMHQSVGVVPRYNFELYKLLQSLGFRVTPCHDLNEFIETAKNYNFIFTIYNRADFRNSEVLVSSVCEYFKIPYLGAPPNLRAIAEDKYFGKVLAASLGIPTGPSKIFKNHNDIKEKPDFPGPYFIKPRFGAASEEIENNSFQNSWENSLPVVIQVLDKGKECIVEPGIEGIDITVPVLGGDPPIILPCVEDLSHLPFGIVTYCQKRQMEKGTLRSIFKDNTLNETLKNYALCLSKQLKPFDYLRLDFRLEKNSQKLCFLEVGFGCNLSSFSAFSLAAKHIQLTQKDIINHIISYSLRRQENMQYR
jgi:D-alanine-D-alanine ligase